jgi:ATP phosphoribosyltransferase regulatory subunit
MKRNNKITPEGTRDLLFEECLARRSVEKITTSVFAARGFHEVVTPGIEFYDVFDPEFSGISPDVMYKTTDLRGRLVAMRPDSTLPIARLTATRLQNQKRPIRLYYSQPIFRNNPGLAGRSNESNQTGIELLGAGGIRADLEVIETAAAALSKCVPGYRLELGHAGFFKALSQQLPVGDEVREDIRSAIESKNYAALNTILDGLTDCPSVRAMRKLPRLFGGEEVFEEAAPLCGDGSLRETLDYLHGIYRSLSALDLDGRLMVDLGLVQRNDYYTGIVFSAYVETFGDAVLLGGRYDNLLEHFGLSMPAIGFSMNVDAIARCCATEPKSRSVPPDVLVHGDDGFEMKALLYAAELSETGLRCETSITKTREEAAAYAKECGIGRVDFVSATVRTETMNGIEEL